jgi:hypothetical protein
MEIRDPSPGLYNEDLAPARQRNWGAFSIFNVWTSDVHSLWGYYLAASLFLLCGSFINFVLAPPLACGAPTWQPWFAPWWPASGTAHRRPPRRAQWSRC